MILGFVIRVSDLSGAHFHDLAFENFQGLLDQGIVLKIVFIEWNWRRFILLRRILRTPERAAAIGGEAFGAGTVALGPVHRLALEPLAAIPRPTGASALTNLICVLEWPSSDSLVCKQRMVSGIVHQANVILEIRGQIQW